MSELWLDEYVIPGAELGMENPQPIFREREDTRIPISESVDLD